MQNRYVGDIGDFAKYSFLNCLAGDQLLGVAWYLFPDETHNADGKHIHYLSKHREWRNKDPYVFDRLLDLIESGQRSVENVEKRSVLGNAIFSGRVLDHASERPRDRSEFRKAWFSSVLSDLAEADIVFADPDNGVREVEKYRFGRRRDWKSIPESEARELGTGRTAVIYHHNTRRRGGHEREIQYWMAKLEADFAVRMRAYSARTYFVLNASVDHQERARSWCARFGSKYQFVKSEL